MDDSSESSHDDGRSAIRLRSNRTEPPSPGSTTSSGGTPRDHARAGHRGPCPPAGSQLHEGLTVHPAQQRLMQQPANFHPAQPLSEALSRHDTGCSTAGRQHASLRTTVVHTRDDAAVVTSAAGAQATEARTRAAVGESQLETQDVGGVWASLPLLGVARSDTADHPTKETSACPLAAPATPIDATAAVTAQPVSHCQSGSHRQSAARADSATVKEVGRRLYLTGQPVVEETPLPLAQRPAQSAATTAATAGPLAQSSSPATASLRASTPAGRTGSVADTAGGGAPCADAVTPCAHAVRRRELRAAPLEAPPQPGTSADKEHLAATSCAGSLLCILFAALLDSPTPLYDCHAGLVTQVGSTEHM